MIINYSRYLARHTFRNPRFPHYSAHSPLSTAISSRYPAGLNILRKLKKFDTRPKTPAPLKVLTIESQYDALLSPEEDPPTDPSIYMKRPNPYSFSDIIWIDKFKEAEQVKALLKYEPYCVINLCDGSPDQGRAGVEVIDNLEKYNIPYTGADRKFYTCTKHDMKRIAVESDVKTPKWVFAYSHDDIEHAINTMQFPMFVKHFNGYASVDLTARSRVSNAQELRRQAKFFIDKHQGALIEEFLDGREFTCLVVENPEDEQNPIPLKPIEITFPRNGDNFKHWDLKWKSFDNMRWIPVEDSAEENKIKEMAKRMFIAMNGRGYGRIDARMNARGELYFLELNANCGIFYQEHCKGSADFCLTYDERIDHQKFIEMLIQCAIKHAEDSKKKKQKNLELSIVTSS